MEALVLDGRGLSPILTKAKNTQRKLKRLMQVERNEFLPLIQEARSLFDAQAYREAGTV
jgi:hypothetical protein